MARLHLSMLVPTILLFALPFSLSLDCYPPPVGGQLPILAHCDDLVAALFYGSRLPHQDDAKTWGRGLPSDLHTESLPKLYWLAGRGPQTCAINLDADPLHPDARETFRLRAVAIGAARIEEVCLKNRREIGRDHLGPTGLVVAKLVRSEVPNMLRITRGKKVLTIPGVGELMEATRAENETLDDMK
ncbi:MAG: hypothetical protein Q9225_000894 [Loekoesia sp. 1 TL-2023]